MVSPHLERANREAHRIQGLVEHVLDDKAREFELEDIPGADVGTSNISKRAATAAQDVVGD
ncbi:uncharacterized protein DNG_02696 [Cephalotrichum gorgonifer]|uniref:Uncharacterized protein n=1 Tax=Cephalotrichum gorgonifer TaxID=2041049 RepID=A0AAE8MSX1_9PEZI|nr:uncharacterized protein DNG_02696 [Cephalotrichum gorgonifer]